MGLQRKKVTVRTKRGKVYQRSMMVQAQAIGRRAGKSGKLNALNPWDIQHTEHVKTNSALGARAKAYGSSGPGSDHSWLALAVGAQRSREHATKENNDPFMESFTRSHASMRRMTGKDVTQTSWHSQEGMEKAESVFRAHEGRAPGTFTRHWSAGLGERYGAANIHEVHQDPRRWVR